MHNTHTQSTYAHKHTCEHNPRKHLSHEKVRIVSIIAQKHPIYIYISREVKPLLLKSGTYRRMCWFGGGECRDVFDTQCEKTLNARDNTSLSMGSVYAYLLRKRKCALDRIRTLIMLAIARETTVRVVHYITNIIYIIKHIRVGNIE